MELARTLGTDRVIDYTAEDFTEIGETFDSIFDAIGETTLFHCRSLLKPGAVFATTDLGPWWQSIFLDLWSSVSGKGGWSFRCWRSKMTSLIS